MKISFLPLAFLAGAVALVHLSANSQDVPTKILSIITQDRENKAKFCGKGSTIIKNTIRSFNGVRCGDQIAAALAMGACGGYDGFDTSKCQGLAKKALALLKKASDQEAIMTLLDTHRGEACDLVAQFLPDELDACREVAGLKKLPVKPPVTPATPPVVTPPVVTPPVVTPPVVTPPSTSAPSPTTPAVPPKTAPPPALPRTGLSCNDLKAKFTGLERATIANTVAMAGSFDKALGDKLDQVARDEKFGDRQTLLNALAHCDKN